MPANPGQKRAQEKRRKKRDVAQKARRVDNVRKAAVADEQRKVAGEEQKTLAADMESSPFGQGIDYDALDEATSAIDKLIKAKQYDEAEKKCGALNRDFPGVSDGLQRMARIDELRGDKSKALTTLYAAQKRANFGDEEAAEEIDKEIARLEKELGK